MRFCLILLITFVTFWSSSAGISHAKQEWTFELIDSASLPAEIVEDTREFSQNALPDGRIAVGGNGASIKQAWYARPTTRYNHGVLGDKIEGGSLVVVTARGVKLRYQLAETQVFEDITPRLVDLDGDGITEIITIESSLLAGAALSIYQVNGGVLVRRVRSNYIGRPYRWLNIAGINRYTGSTTPEIALVITPHIGGRLELYKYSSGKMIRIFREKGFSNHVSGSREQRLSASYLAPSGRRVNLALPSADRRSLRIMQVGNSGWQQVGIIALPAPINKAILATGSGDNVQFTVGTSDGNVYLIQRVQP